MNAVAKIDREKLGKICGLFGSDHVGERAEAARRADLIVKQAGATWPEVLRQEPSGDDYFQQPPHRDVPLSAGQILAHYGNRLTDWEKRFLSSIIRQHGRMSSKQRPIFEEIRERFAGCGR